RRAPPAGDPRAPAARAPAALAPAARAPTAPRRPGATADPPPRRRRAAPGGWRGRAAAGGRAWGTPGRGVDGTARPGVRFPDYAACARRRRSALLQPGRGVDRLAVATQLEIERRAALA